MEFQIMVPATHKFYTNDFVVIAEETAETQLMSFE